MRRSFVVAALLVVALACVAVSACDDSPPDNNYTCQQQKDCQSARAQAACSSETWMTGHCQTVCGTCGGSGTTTCADIPPPGNSYSCAQQKEWGKCGESWMVGYCRATCGTCGGGGGSTTTSTALTPSLVALAINAPGYATTQSAPLKSYGYQYGVNKRKVVASLQAAGIGAARVKLMLAVAMLETNTMDPAQRDTGKTGDSTNYSLYNLNRDMLSRIGGYSESMNYWSGLDLVSERIQTALGKWGVNSFLDFHRGGSTGLADHVSYGCADYRAAMASMVRILDNNPTLMSDDRRIDMYVVHV